MLAEHYPLRVLLMAVSGFVDRHQADVMADLPEESHVHEEHIGDVGSCAARQPLSLSLETSREFESPSASGSIPTPWFRLGVPTLTVANREQWPSSPSAPRPRPQLDLWRSLG